MKAMGKCIKNIWEGGGIPEQWKGGIIKPIHKKEGRDVTENYRGITFMDTGYKIYAEWLRRKLVNETNVIKVLDKTQFGFRKGKGTTVAIYVLSEIIEKQIEVKLI